MGKIWFTSDLHLGHDREFMYGPRGFSSIFQHDEELLARWNSVVAPEDTVYILGDLILNSNEHGMKFLNWLNGEFHVILGNHDTSTRIKLYEECEKIKSIQYATMIKYKKGYFYLSHYPTLTANYEEEGPWHKNIINLYGHTHQQTKFFDGNPFMYHVGLDSHNCYPVNIDEIISDIQKQRDLTKIKNNVILKEKED
jgi:calcineurin-like phosphoesterase family protein